MRHGSGPPAGWPPGGPARPRCPIEGACPPVDTCRVAKPEPPKPIGWNVHKIASKAAGLGEVEASDEAAAIEKAAAEYFWKGAQVERPFMAIVRHSEIETIVWYTGPGRGATPPKIQRHQSLHRIISPPSYPLIGPAIIAGIRVFVVGAPTSRDDRDGRGHDMGEVVQYDQGTPSQ